MNNVELNEIWLSKCIPKSLIETVDRGRSFFLL